MKKQICLQKMNQQIKNNLIKQKGEKMENELLEEFIIRINDLQKEINKKYEKELEEVMKKDKSKQCE